MKVGLIHACIPRNEGPPNNFFLELPNSLNLIVPLGGGDPHPKNNLNIRKTRVTESGLRNGSREIEESQELKNWLAPTKGGVRCPLFLTNFDVSVAYCEVWTCPHLTSYFGGHP